MKTITALLALTLACLGMASAVGLCTACGAQAAQQDAVRSSYAADVQLCIGAVDAGAKSKAEAWAEADTCRKAVDARYGVDASAATGAK